MSRCDDQEPLAVDATGALFHPRGARVSGILAILGAFALVAGDLLLLSPATGQSVIVARAQVPTSQVYLSGLLAVLAIWLYAIGGLHVMFGLHPARRAARLLAGLSLAAFVLGTGIYHVIFPALMFGAQVAASEVTGDTAELALALPGGYAQLLLGLAVIAPGTVFTLGFSWLVSIGATDYPRWFALLNPMILLAVLWLTETTIALTGVQLSLGPYYGQLINILFAVFFITSTALLWKR